MSSYKIAETERVRASLGELMMIWNIMNSKTQSGPCQGPMSVNGFTKMWFDLLKRADKLQFYTEILYIEKLDLDVNVLKTLETLKSGLNQVEHTLIIAVLWQCILTPQSYRLPVSAMEGWCSYKVGIRTCGGHRPVADSPPAGPLLLSTFFVSFTWIINSIS